MKYCVFFIVFVLGLQKAFPGTSGIPRLVNTYPMRGATNVHPYTGIGLTFTEPLLRSGLADDSIIVSDIHGNPYPGTLKLSTNGKTIIFKPSRTFQLGAVIMVRFGSFRTVDERMTSPDSMSFTTRDRLAYPDTVFHSDDPVLELQLHPNLLRRGNKMFGAATLNSEPLALPQFNTFAENNPSDGQMYLANYRYVSDQTNTFRLILDKYGEAVSAEGGGPDYFNDFKPNPDGTYSFYDYENGAFFILDSSQTLIRKVGATYGYVTDAHEIRPTADGNYYIIAADYVFLDLSQLVSNGWTQATVLVPLIQEFDRDSNLIFEWRTTDHFKITDATHENLTLSYIDFCHINAIEFDADSNLLISCRHMDEITKINRRTGEIMWRLGGKNNQFTFIGDSLLFSHQHSIRRTEQGTYTLFDNGNFHPQSSWYSRALEYRLDEQNLIATKIWEFRHKPDIFSLAMGYVQRLPNGNTFIGWGESDTVSVTEVGLKNETLYEMGMTDGNYSYRAYKYDSSFLKSNSSGVAQRSATPSDFSLSCTPNPVTEQAQVECSLSKSEVLNITLYDELGRSVRNFYSGEISPGDHLFLIKSEDFPAGVYYLRAIRNDGFSISKEVVIQK